MRYIPLLENFLPDDEWSRTAKQLLEKLKAAPDSNARKKIIDSNAKVWGELKSKLLTLSDDKCWFSEADDCFSYFDVEHFRPKKSLKDENGVEHEGYWWLSFDWQNFRICGNVGNRRKSTYFPLRPGSKRCSKPEDELREEDYQLLDPADPDDPGLLSFDFEGRAIPAPNLQDEWDKLRVTYSVERLNLDYPLLISKRKLYWNECFQHIEKYRNELEKYHKDKNNLIARESYKTEMREIRKMIKKGQPLTALVRACVLSTGDERVIRILQSS